MVVLRLIIALVSLFIATFFIFGGLVLFQPEWIFTKLSQRSPDVLYSVETIHPVVALTIDDGPDPETTPLILDILADWDVHATFFLITDRIPGNENLVRRILSEGHEIGNHMTSDEPSIQLGLQEFERRLDLSASVLSEYGEIQWFRPGSGWYNNDMLEIIHDKGYRCVLGSIYPYDPHLGSSWFSTRYVLWKVKPGSIIILHDHGTRGDRTVVSLKKILPELDHRGYEVVKLSDLVAVESTD